MNLEDLISDLNDAGWCGRSDAQHERIESVLVRINEQETLARMWVRCDEALNGLRRECEYATRQGWQHLSVTTIQAHLHIPAYESDKEMREFLSKQ